MYLNRKVLCGVAALISLSSVQLTAQEAVLDGYALYSVFMSNKTELVDVNKKVVHTWTHATSSGGMAGDGYSAQLLPDGNLVRPRKGGSTGSRTVIAGTGTIEVIDKEGKAIWSYTHTKGTDGMHHSLEPLPNGNVLAIVSERKTAAEAEAKGFSGLSNGIDLDYLIEVAPPSGSQPSRVVWEWHLWDHLVKGGEASAHPEKLSTDIRGLTDKIFKQQFGGSSALDWTHTNGMGYNPELDQIVFTLRFISEVVVIDHSTTTEEAKGSTGGKYKKGGDFLYRWGRPETYGATGSPSLFVVHSAHFIPAGLPGAGHLMMLNNGTDKKISEIIEIAAPHTGGVYEKPATGKPFGPDKASWIYNDGTSFFTNGQGSCQRLPNGNTFICNSQGNSMFEVTASKQKVWEYKPSKGDLTRALKYSKEYPGIRVLLFNEKPVALTNSPQQLSSSRPVIVQENGCVTVRSGLELTVRVYSLSGHLLCVSDAKTGFVQVPLHSFAPGSYCVNAAVPGASVQKIVHVW